MMRSSVVNTLGRGVLPDVCDFGRASTAAGKFLPRSGVSPFGGEVAALRFLQFGGVL